MTAKRFRKLMVSIGYDRESIDFLVQYVRHAKGKARYDDLYAPLRELYGKYIEWTKTGRCYWL